MLKAKEKIIRTKRRKFENICGRDINVLCKPLSIGATIELDVPLNNVGRQNEQLWITSSRQEIDNLLSHEYIKELKIENGVVSENKQNVSQEGIDPHPTQKSLF